jgi:hypothetical protein
MLLDEINEKDVCSLKKDEGRCNNLTEKWYFDQSSRSCFKFTYKGKIEYLKFF